MKFQELKIQQEKSWIKRIFSSQHARRSFLFIVLGATAGFLFFYFNEGKQMDVITTGDILRSTFIGGFFGYFITNSPCARGRC
jgi:hypothetical protein